ncbi:MAG TPA: hypothetical protein VMM76_12315 [Pirellulaceae bacterium]|nr:hypothetical protein [Pirellulaceae bacterium]
MTRRATLQLFAFVSLVATIGYALDNNDSANSDSGHSDTEPQATPIAHWQGARPHEVNGAGSDEVRLREGMKFVNRIGELRNVGGRVAFYPDGATQSLPLLENLALERIERDVDQPHRKWSVSGIVTEYKGVNYLLLHRAVLKTRVSHSSGPRS